MDEVLSLFKVDSLSDALKYIVGALAGATLTITYHKSINKNSNSISQKVKGNNNIQSGRDSHVKK